MLALIIILEIIAVFAIAYSALALTLYFMQPKLLYKPLREVTYTPEDLNLEYEDLMLTAEDGVMINGWYVRGNGNYTVLFCHGNGGNLTHRLDTIHVFRQLGLSCLAFDYRGYGKSQGKTTEAGTYLDVRAAYDWLVETKGVDPGQLIIFGRSLGASVAAYLAQETEVASVVLESAFTSFGDIGKKFYPYMPVKHFTRFEYRTIDYLRNVHVPVLIIHSRSDEVVPFEFALELYNASNEPSKLVEIWGSHNDGFLISNGLYRKTWSQWVESIITAAKGRKVQ